MLSSDAVQKNTIVREDPVGVEAKHKFLVTGHLRCIKGGVEVNLPQFRRTKTKYVLFNAAIFQLTKIS